MSPEYLSIEGADSEDWMVLDAGSVVVHCFTPEARKGYDLQGLWENYDEFVQQVEQEAQEQEDQLERAREASRVVKQQKMFRK